MAKITKIYFTTSNNGNPCAVLWVDDMDTTKESEAIRIYLKPQVSYLIFCGKGSEIEIKKGNKDFYNIVIPKSFSDIIDNYKITDNKAMKLFGTMLSNGIENLITSVDFIRNGEVARVSREEAQTVCHEHMKDTATYIDFAVEELKQSPNKFLKSIGKLAEKEDLKASEVKEVNKILLKHADRLARCMEKNNLVIVEEDEK